MSHIDIETKIMGRTVDALLAAGYSLSVNDGEETTVKRSRDRDEIIGALWTTGEDYIIPHEANGARAGFVWLIHGNGVDVISDYSENLEPVLAPVNAFAETL